MTGPKLGGLQMIMIHGTHCPRRSGLMGLFRFGGLNSELAEKSEKGTPVRFPFLQLQKANGHLVCFRVSSFKGTNAVVRFFHLRKLT